MSEDNIAIDSDGRPLPHSSDEVRAIVNRAMRDGDLLMAVFETSSGDLAVQVFGPPSERLLEILDTTAKAYRTALRGH